MNLYEVVMKGPPRWFRRTGIVIAATAFALAYLTLGVQIGMYKERSKNTKAAITKQLAEKNAKIDRLLIALNDAQFDLAVEKVKIEILVCESDVKHDGVWGDGGRSYGIAQFQHRTFDWMRREAGRPELRWTNKRHQLWLLDWALRNGYGRYWTCYGKARRNGNTVAIRQAHGGEQSRTTLVQRGKR